jgi:hypothetical protein
MAFETSLVNIVKSLLPPKARLLVSKTGYRAPAVFLEDVDNDDENEVVALYSLGGQRYAIILKREGSSWYVLSNEKHQLRLDTGCRAVNLFLAPVKTVKGTKYGYINTQAQFAIKPQFDYAYDYQDNRIAVVSINNLSGLIDINGNYILRPKYDSIGQFAEGRAAAIDKQGFNIIDETGKEVTSKAYSYIGSFSNGRAVFAGTDASGKYLYGFLDRQGNEAIPLSYESAPDFSNGTAIVKLKEMQYALIDVNGKMLQTYNYSFVGSQGEGLLAFQKEQDGKLGYIDLKGNVIIEPKFTGALSFKDGRAPVNIAEDYQNKYGLIDRKGNFVIKPEYNDINLIGEGRVSIGKSIDPEKPFIGSKYAVADINGNFLTDFIYNSVENYDKGLASVYDNKNTFFIDRTGKAAKGSPVVSGSGSLTVLGELIRAFVDNRTSYYDKSGKLVWQQNTVIPLNEQYKVIENKFRPNKDYLVYYPQIDGIKNKKVQQNVNNKLKQLSQVKDIPGNVQLESSYTGDFSVQFFKKNLLVLELEGYDFPFGAAHGMPSRVYPHMDLISGSFYELKDLFKTNSNYVKIISDIIANQIKTDPQYEYLFPDAYQGIKPDQPFYIDHDNLYIFFTPYEIAPYAAGFPTFKIPFKEIMTIINTQGAFWMAFN